MATFYREGDKPTIYKDYTPETGFTGGFSSEAEAQQAGVIPDWDASWKPAGAETNITTITPEKLTAAQPLNLGGAPTDNNGDANVVVAGAKTQAEIDAKAAADAKVAKQEAAKETATEEITDIFTQLEGEGAEQLEAEKEAGIPGMETQIADITGQIGVKTAEFDVLQSDFDALEQELKSQPGTLQGHFIGQRARARDVLINKKNALAAEIGILQAQGLAAQGKLTAAQNAVNRAIDLKYNGLRLKLDTKKFLFDVIRDDLSDAEAAQLKIQEDILARQEQELEEQKAGEVAVENVAIEAALNGAPQEIIDQIKALAESGDVVQASQIAQPYITEAPTIITNKTNNKIITPTEEPLSINQIDQFRRSYGWTPPYGFTEAQLLQFMNDNPNATPEELENGAKQALSGQGEIIEPTEPQTNFPDTVGHIMNTITDEEMNTLFSKAKTAGATKLFRGKRNDVQAYIETFQSQIEEAINQGYSKEEIKEYILGL